MCDNKLLIPTIYVSVNKKLAFSVPFTYGTVFKGHFQLNLYILADNTLASLPSFISKYVWDAAAQKYDTNPHLGSTWPPAIIQVQLQNGVAQVMCTVCVCIRCTDISSSVALLHIAFTVLRTNLIIVTEDELFWERV